MTFMQLWEKSTESDLEPGAKQAWLRQELPKVLAAAGVPWANKGGGTSDRVVLGIAEYSRDDLLLLDMIVAVLPVVGLRLEVFLVSQCASHDEIAEYVPSIGRVFHAPVAAIWRSGVPMQCASGYAARELLRREFGLR